MIATAILAAVLAAIFVFSGARKLPASAKVREEAEHLRLPIAAYRSIGLAEIVGALALAAGIFWRPLGIAAASGLSLLMTGAVTTHIRVGDPAVRTLSALVLGVLSLAALVLRVVFG